MNTKIKDIRTVILAVALWLTTTTLTFFAIVAVLDTLMRVYAAFWADGGFYSQATQTAIGLRQLLVLPLGAVALMGTIGAAEYHWRHFNTRRSWRLFARTLGIELGVLWLSMFI